MRVNIQTKLFFGFFLLLVGVSIIIGTATMYSLFRVGQVMEPLLNDSVSVYDRHDSVVIRIDEEAGNHEDFLKGPELMLGSLARTMLAVLVAVTCLTLILSYMYSRMVINPIKKISAATALIAAGDYSQRVHVKSRDEIQELATALNGMTENLQKIEIMRRDLVSNVSHELGTPLTCIKGYVEALRDGVITDDDETLDTFNMISEETERLNSIINDLRELSKIESTSFELVLQPVRLVEIVEKTVLSLRPKLDQKKLVVSVDIPGDLPNVLADPNRLSQVLVNILDNSIRFTPDEGRIEITAAIWDDSINISITDTGKGIPPGDLPHIFERFFRSDRSRSRETGGTGIGLAIVQELVAAHGSVVTVTSEIGKGSTFSFNLKISK